MDDCTLSTEACKFFCDKMVKYSNGFGGIDKLWEDSLSAFVGLVFEGSVACHDSAANGRQTIPNCRSKLPGKP